MPKIKHEGPAVQTELEQIKDTEEKSIEKFVLTEVESQIDWSNLIFLPFHPVFRMFVLFCVFVKVILGPIQSVYPIVYCYDVMEYNPFLMFIKYCYWYFCDFIYGIDTFLHIVHRQVTDKAMRREYMPKSAQLLLCDLAALIPFFRLVEQEPCPKVRLWPNILAYNEFLVIYRITQYFQLVSTHTYWKLMIGYTLVLGICLNCLTCFWLLLSSAGFCEVCQQENNYFDWRASVLYKVESLANVFFLMVKNYLAKPNDFSPSKIRPLPKTPTRHYYYLNETSEEYSTYVYGFSFIYSFSLHNFYDNECKTSAILEFIMINIFMAAGYILNYFIVIPKAFAEAMFRLRKVCIKFPAVHKIIEETMRRNPSKEAHLRVEDHYKLLWRKRNGIIDMPPIFKEEIPRYLRLEIMQDLLWPLYYHSPTLRKSSFSFRRWISESTNLSYKLPGEMFYSSLKGGTNLYYVKSGIVQLISLDDGVTPILSVTGGTIFGDINFLVPHIQRKVLVRCLTYCEIYYIMRKTLLRALHRYPADKKKILDAANERIKHAKELFSYKQNIKGLDRNDDEGIAWIKRRWWEIFEIIELYVKRTGKSKTNLRCEMPRDETIYHCAKYIGQLALCTRTQLQTKSMFTRLSFPWILNPHSKVGYVWNRIVVGTVLLVLFLHPPNLVKPDIPQWFIFFSHWTDTVYAIDIVLTLFTAVKSSIHTSYAAVLLQRMKSFTFMLDILSTIWIEDIAEIVGRPQFYYTFQFNRLLKVYVLFYGNYIYWDIRKNPFVDVCKKIILVHLTQSIILSHVVFEMTCYIPTITMAFFFGKDLCSKTVTTDCEKIDPYFGVTVSWAFEWIFSEEVTQRLIDSYLGIAVSYSAYMLFIYTKGAFLGYLYLKHREPTNYQRFVIKLKKYYQHYRIHQDIVKRLDRYFLCHWKYYNGIDVMHGNTLEAEPLEVYWKCQGEIARIIISKSRAFSRADPKLISALARAGKFLIMPKLASIFMFGVQCKNVTWVVQGFIKSEFCNEDGEMLTQYYGPGSMLSVSAVFFGRASLRSYIAYTDCEILYIPIQDFFDIYKRNKLEFSYLEACTQEFGPMFNELFQKYVLIHKDYQTKLRDKMYNTKMSMLSTGVIADIEEQRSLPFEGEFWGEPESGFLQTWLLFRSITVFVSIMSASIVESVRRMRDPPRRRGVERVSRQLSTQITRQCGVGAGYRWIFMMISSFCDNICWIDIIMKLFIAYHNKQGILITSKKECLLNYFTKGFALDLLGALPWYELVKFVLKESIDNDTCYLINTMCKFSHIYIIFAYFDYITDIPTVNLTYAMIIKWQLVNVLIALGASHYFMVKCVIFVYNRQMDLVHVGLRDECWAPDYMEWPDVLSWDELHLLFAQSLSFAECGMLGMNFGRYVIDRNHMGIGLILFALSLIFWFITCYSVTLLLLNARGDTVFQYSVYQLKKFLTNERVEKPVIENVTEHFRYCWIRTKGINIQQLTNDRIGVVFRQDVNYYFFKKTLTTLELLLKGGDVMQKQMANACTQVFFLPGYDIFREMDLVTNICIVHRGRVIISKAGKKLIILTKGDIFGQLTGKRLRPVRVTATSEDNVDLLYIEHQVFHSIINDKVRRNIRQNPQYKNDFLATKNIFIENPYDTVQYLLRGRQIIQLPWCPLPTEARHGTWYGKWLQLTWLIGPFVTTAIVLMFYVLPEDSILWRRFYYTLIAFDIVHALNFIAQFYTIELKIENNKCVYRRVGVKLFKSVLLYVDALTFIIPPITLITGQWEYQLARLLRVKFFYDFQINFCRSFKSRTTPFILKLASMILLLHGFACGWIHFGCRGLKKFPLPLLDMSKMNDTIDFTTWEHPEVRGEGCARATRNIHVITSDGEELYKPTFVVPKAWQHDYVIAMTFILLIHTHTSIDSVLTMNLSQTYYKVFVTFIMYIIDIYIVAYAINAAYTKYHELYQYDYAVNNMLTYLADWGIVKSLVEAVLKYTEQLWQREKGDKLPNIAYQGPPCIRQDLFTALYIHHLDAAPTFRALPFYFKRQLVARLERMVIFPGKYIIREGDTFNTTYFIHEGEVEKWYVDENGDSKLLSVLYTNGYFGCIAGIFVNVGFQFSYYTRTVVDLVYLNLNKWQDLLEGHPDIKKKLYESTSHLKKEYARNHWHKTTSQVEMQSSTMLHTGIPGRGPGPAMP